MYNATNQLFLGILYLDLGRKIRGRLLQWLLVFGCAEECRMEKNHCWVPLKIQRRKYHVKQHLDRERLCIAFHN